MAEQKFEFPKGHSHIMHAHHQQYDGSYSIKNQPLLMRERSSSIINHLTIIGEIVSSKTWLWYQMLEFNILSIINMNHNF